jgi:hypothetical protein
LTPTPRRCLPDSPAPNWLRPPKAETAVSQGASERRLGEITIARKHGAQVLVTEGNPGRMELPRPFEVHEVVDVSDLTSVAKHVEAVRRASRGNGLKAVVAAGS